MDTLARWLTGSRARKTMATNEALRDLADRIGKLASQYELYASVEIDDRHRRLLLTTAVGSNAVLRDALDAHEYLHDFAETDKSFDELAEFLEAVEAKHRRRAEVAASPRRANGAWLREIQQAQQNFYLFRQNHEDTHAAVATDCCR
jgi:hypothetical protein